MLRKNAELSGLNLQLVSTTPDGKTIVKREAESEKTAQAVSDVASDHSSNTAANESKSESEGIVGQRSPHSQRSRVHHRASQARSRQHHLPQIPHLPQSHHRSATHLHHPEHRIRPQHHQNLLGSIRERFNNFKNSRGGQSTLGTSKMDSPKLASRLGERKDQQHAKEKQKRTKQTKLKTSGVVGEKSPISKSSTDKSDKSVAPHPNVQIITQSPDLIDD